MRIILGIAVVLIGLLVTWLSLFPVDRGEYVYVTQFGRPVATYDGLTDGGLHAKLPWPVQSVQSLDRRLQYFDLPETELLTHDPERQTIDKTLTLVAYVCWRIKDRDSVDLFVRRLGTPERARAVLGERIRSQLGGLVSKMRLDDLISTDPGRVETQMKELRDQLLDKAGAEHSGQGRSLRELAATEYGIELADVRLRRTNHPAAVRDAIFARIRSERQKKVADYQSEGTRLAENIRTDAEAQAVELLAAAKAEEQRLRGEATTRADQIRNQAHSQDVEFYAFLKKLEEYQRILGDNKSMLLLSSRGEMFDLLFKPPKPNGTPGSGGIKP